MQRIAQSSTTPWRLLIVLVLACVAMGLLLGVWRPAPKPAPFVVLHQPFQMPRLFRDRLGRWITATPGWTWAWRVQEAVFGRRKPVNLSAEVVSLTDISRPRLASLPLGPANFAHTNGLQVWLLGADQLKALREQLSQRLGAEPPFRPRVSTADGIECQLVQGQSIARNGSINQVRSTFGCCARLHRDYTDLMACVTLSELVTNEAAGPGGTSAFTPISIQTNLDMALRLQIPKGRGVFVLDRSSRESGRQSIGVIIDPPQPGT